MENEKRFDFSDAYIGDIIKYAPSEKSDLFFFCGKMPDFSFFEHTVKDLRENILVVLPFYAVIPESILKNSQNEFTVLELNPLSEDSDFAVKKSSKNILCFADVRLFSEDRFWRFAEHINFSRIFVLFADCANLYEYGYRQSFSLTGEYRASQKQYIHLTAFFNQMYENAEDFTSRFYTQKLISVNTLPQKLPAEFVEKGNQREKYIFLASSLKNEPLEKTAVVFATRRALYEFISHLKKPIDELSIAHGGMSVADFGKSLNDFYSGKTKILLATKAVFSSSVFIGCDKVYYCSLPFSVANLYSVYSLLKNRDSKVSCVYCNEDVLLLSRLAVGVAEYFGIEEKDEFIKNRLLGLNEIIKNIRKEKVK